MENYEICMPPLAAPFAMVHGPVIVDRNLNSSAVHLYSLLWCLGDRMKEGWHSQALLADLLGVTDRTIRNGLTTLRKAGLIVTTVRRPQPTLIRIVDPNKIYGVFMVQFYDHVKDRSAALQAVEPSQPEDSNRKNSSGSIGKKFPMKKIKGSKVKYTRGSTRRSVDKVFKGVEEQTEISKAKRKPKTPRKKTTPGLHIPHMTPRTPSRWGGAKFYLHCVECARIKGVPVIDPYQDCKDLKRSRFSREMGYALEAFQNRGFTKKQFADLLTSLFENWSFYSHHFRKQQFTVYDLRPKIVELCDGHQALTDSPKLANMLDFEPENERPTTKGQVFYLDDE